MEKGNLHSDRRQLRHLPLRNSLLLAKVSDETFEFHLKTMLNLPLDEGSTRTQIISGVVLTEFLFPVSVETERTTEQKFRGLGPLQQ